MAGPFLLLGRKTAFPVRTMQSEGCFYSYYSAPFAFSQLCHMFCMSLFFLDAIAKNCCIPALSILFFCILP